MKKALTILLLLGICVGMMSGCGIQGTSTTTANTTTAAATTAGTTSAEETTKQEEVKLVIGYTPLSMEFEYFQTVVSNMQAECDKIGAKLIVKDPQMDAAKQTTGIEEMIASGCNIIVICSVDPAAADASAKYCKEKGVKVISHVSNFKGADSYVGLDELAFGTSTGEAAGQYIKENLGGKAKVAILNADTLGGNLLLRSKGLVDGLIKYAPDATIVKNVTAFSEEKALTEVETILQANPDLNIIETTNDPGAYGALSAVKAAGKEGQIKIFAIGGDIRLGDLIAAGSIEASTDSNPEWTGQKMVEIANLLIQGKTVDLNITIPQMLLTKDNIGPINEARKAAANK